jgi:hypothetical protein
VVVGTDVGAGKVQKRNLTAENTKSAEI